MAEFLDKAGDRTPGGMNAFGHLVSFERRSHAKR